MADCFEMSFTDLRCKYPLPHVHASNSEGGQFPLAKTDLIAANGNDHIGSLPKDIGTPSAESAALRRVLSTVRDQVVWLPFELIQMPFGACTRTYDASRIF